MRSTKGVYIEKKFQVLSLEVWGQEEKPSMTTGGWGVGLCGKEEEGVNRGVWCKLGTN